MTAAAPASDPGGANTTSARGSLVAIVREEMSRQDLSFRVLSRHTRQADAHGVGLSSGHIANICAGRTKASLRAVLLLEEALGVTLTSLPEARHALVRAQRLAVGERDPLDTRCEVCAVSTREVIRELPDTERASFLRRVKLADRFVCANCAHVYVHGRPLVQPTLDAFPRTVPPRAHAISFREHAVKTYTSTPRRSLRAVATELGVSAPTLCRWVRAATAEPTP